MKRCEKCGAVQNDSRTVCIDCGAMLGKTLDAKEEEKIRERLDDTLDGMSGETQEFFVPLRDKIMGVLAAAGIIAAVVLLILTGGGNGGTVHGKPAVLHEPGITAVIRDSEGNAAVISDGETQDFRAYAQEKRNDAAGKGALAGLICLVAALPLLVIPKVMWFLDTMKYRLFYNWETAPSYFALMIRKVFAYLFFAGGMIGVLYGYWQYLL